MNKKKNKAIKDTIIAFIVIIVIRSIYCFFKGTDIFTVAFIISLVIFIISSIFFRFILKDYDD